MELFWYVFIRVCWALGTILTLYEFCKDKETQENLGSLRSMLEDDPEFMPLGFLAVVLLMLACSLWPIWKIRNLIKRICKKEG